MALAWAVMLISYFLYGTNTPADASHRPKYSSHIKSRCFKSLGCYSIEYPFNNTYFLPDSPRRINTRFWIYPPNSYKKKSLRLDRDYNKIYKASLPTKVIIPGFNPYHENFAWVDEMANELQKTEPMNVIIVDWSGGAGFPYEQAVANTRVVGKQIANLLIHLNPAHPKRRFMKLHLIGHSLGAHIASYTANHLKHVYRISGLDPAGPNFQDTVPKVRLDADDADFVDVIHTDGAMFLAIKGFGTMKSMGDVDFYPNGGKRQPGCQGTWLDLAIRAYNTGIKNASNSVGCSHSRAIFLYIESIKSTCFTAVQCDNSQNFTLGKCKNGEYITMGYHLRKNVPKGSYFLNTLGRRPYCGYNYIIDMYVAQNTTLHGVYIRIVGTKGISSKRHISGDPISTAYGNKVGTVLLAHRNLGEIKQVLVLYAPESRFRFFLYKSTIQVLGITVTDVTHHSRFKSCNKMTIASDSRVVFHKKNSNTNCI